MVNERFVQMFEQTASFRAVLHGPTHIIEIVNPAFMRLIDHRDVVGQAVGDALMDLVPHGYVQLLDEVYKSGQAHTEHGVSYRVKPVPGGVMSLRYVNLLHQPIKSNAGVVTGILIEGSDVTEAFLRDQMSRKILEQQLVDRAAALQQAEKIMRTVFDTSHQNQGLLNAEGKIVYVNPTSLASIKGRLEDVIGKAFWDTPWFAETPGVPTKIRDAVAQVAGGKAVLIFLELNMPTGHRAYNFSMRPVFDESGKVLAMIPEAVEITARVQVEEGLRRALRLQRADDRKSALLALGDRLRALKEPDAIAIAAGTVIGETLRVAQAAYAIVHDDGDNVTVLKPWLRDDAVLSLEGSQRFSDFGRYADQLNEGKVIFVTDAKIDQRTIDRVENFVACGISAFVNMPLMQNGRMVGMILAFDDRPRLWPSEDLAFMRSVADRTWSALATAAAEADLRALNLDLERKIEERTVERDRVWSNSQDLLCILDQNGIFQAANPAWFAVLGWHPSEIVGRHHLSVNHLDHRSASEAVLLKAARVNVSAYEARLLHKNGSDRWISWVATSEESLVYASGRDITDEKAAQADLKATQEALRQSQKMEAVGQLTGGIAHDFNNLLGGISGNLELLETRMAQGRFADATRYIAAAQHSARRAASLTQRLLAFSRRQTLDPKPTEIDRLIAGIADLVHQTVGPNVELELVEADEVWLTKIDPSQLENALLNLCINARDAMPHGGRIIIETANRWLDGQAGLEPGLAPGPYISLSVTDTGSGMASEVIAQAFDPFFTTKPLGQGTGLGLSMIHGFVHQSGGQIRIQSELGKGTTVCIYLPRFSDQKPKADRAYANADKPEAPDTAKPGQGETILVIDDVPVLRMLMVEVLKDAGYRTIQACDGPEGLKILNSDASIDLLLTDVGLPGGLNGRQVADIARITRPNLKVLFVTGYAEQSIVGDGHLDIGMQVMTKPFVLAVLSNKVREMIETTDY